MGGGAAGSAGGSSGASFAAWFLPTERHEQTVRVSQSIETVLALVTDFLLREGRIVNGDEAGASPHSKIAGVIGSGFLKMNPTVVNVEVLSVGRDSCTLLVSAAAKEGLIKQQSAQKTVARIVEVIVRRESSQ